MIITSMLGVYLVFALMIGSIPSSFAEIVGSPYQQLASGIMIENIQCRDDRILVIRTNGSPACVTAITAEKTGWQIIDLASNMPAENQISSHKNTKQYFDLKFDNSGHETGGSFLDPIVSFDIPQNIAVGETFDINYSISWIDDNGEPLYPQYAALADPSHIVIKPQLLLPDEFTIVSEGFSPFLVLADYNSPHLLVLYKGEGIVYDDSKIITGSIQVKLTEAMSYEKDNLIVYLYDGTSFQITSDANDDVTLIAASELGTEYVDYTLPDDDLRSSVIYSIDTDTQSWHSAGQSVSSGADGLPIHVPPGELSQSAKSVSSTTESMSEEEKYIPEQNWEDFAQWLRDYTPNDTTPMREWLLFENMSEKFVDDFLKEYPEFLIQN